jgi:hypothetical protein
MGRSATGEKPCLAWDRGADAAQKLNLSRCTSIFDKGMLKSAAGPEKRHAIDPCEPDREQSAAHVGVRTARHAPQPVECRNFSFNSPAGVAVGIQVIST